MADFLVLDSGNGTSKIPTKAISDVRSLKPLVGGSAWEILKFLGKKPAYPAEIAKSLRMHEQKVYYCIKQLRAAGLVKVVHTEEMHGALAKYYSPVFESFCIVPGGLKQGMQGRGFPLSAAQKPGALNGRAKEFFEPFIRDGALRPRIVVGSPDLHGSYRARARDAHLVAELCAFLGAMSTEVSYPLVFLDTMIPSLAECNHDLIIVGGPITNKLAAELNEKIPLRFEPSGGHWAIRSEITGREYVEDAMGIIVKVPHPSFPDKRVLLIAGKRNAGTRAAITALIKNIDDIAKPHPQDANLSGHVVEGLDLDGDGQIDAAEIKE